MAPMSGSERSPVAPLRARAGNFLYEHGGFLFNFQGLRAYKEKFNPVWEPHYLVYPGGLKLPRHRRRRVGARRRRLRPNLSQVTLAARFTGRPV